MSASRASIRSAILQNLERRCELNVGASWELDLFGGRDATRDAARAEWQASAAGAQAARLAVIAQTADTYIQISALQARLSIARDQVKTQQGLTDLVRLQYQKGVAAELQLRQTEGALGQLRSALPALQNQLDMTMNALDILVGEQPGTAQAELDADAPEPAPPGI